MYTRITLRHSAAIVRIRLLLVCLWYYVGEGGLDLAEGTDWIPGVSYDSGTLLSPLRSHRPKDLAHRSRSIRSCREAAARVSVFPNLSQPAASALAQVFGGFRRLRHPLGSRRHHQQVFVVNASEEALVDPPLRGVSCGAAVR